jgi:hypothetical protein
MPFYTLIYAKIVKGERNGKEKTKFLTFHCRAASYIRENKDNKKAATRKRLRIKNRRTPAMSHAPP